MLTSIIGRAPYVAVLIVGLYWWLVHPRRWTRGMNYFGIGIIGNLLLCVVAPVISAVYSNFVLANRASVSPFFLSLGHVVMQSLIATGPLAFLLYGGFELAKERDEEHRDRDADDR